MLKYLKRISLFVLILALTFTTIFSIGISTTVYALTDDQLLDNESQKCFDFFWNEANTNTSSPGYGLIRDRDGSGPASIASDGYGLAALAIGASRGWITKQQGYDRALGTLNTFLNNCPRVNGFYYHFLDMDTCQRSGGSEVSIIDTAILIEGAICAGEYFGGDVKTKAEQLYRNANWNWFRDAAVNQFYMGYTPERGFEGHWDFYAENLQLYFLAAGSPSYPLNNNMFYSFTRHTGSYGGNSCINTWFGSIFAYQYSHAWFDLRNKKDNQGVDWWNNSVKASQINRQYCIDNAGKFNTYNSNSWGLTASDGPNGYSGLYGSAPSGINNDQHKDDGTIAPSGPAGSIVFMPTEVTASLQYFYNNFPKLWGTYGFKDAYNTSKNWYAPGYIGIDKGITILMLENYRTGFIWNNFMKNQYVQNGMTACGIVNNGGPTPTPTPTPSPIGKAIPGKIEAESYNAMSGIQTEACTDAGGGLNVGWTDVGDWMDYYVNVQTAGSYKVDFRVASGVAGSANGIQLKKGATVLSTVSVPNTGGWQNWQVVSVTVNLSAGAQTLRVYVNNAGWNLNWLNFTASGVPTPTPTPGAIIDNFDGTAQNTSWADGGDGRYTLSNSNTVAFSPITSKKVVYNKGTSTWAYFYTSPTAPGNYSTYNKFNMKVYGNTNILVKFEAGTNTYERNFILAGGNAWQDLTWDISSIKGNLTNVKRILFFVDGGTAGTSGTFYIDDIQFTP